MRKSDGGTKENEYQWKSEQEHKTKQPELHLHHESAQAALQEANDGVRLKGTQGHQGVLLDGGLELVWAGIPLGSTWKSFQEGVGGLQV